MLYFTYFKRLTWGQGQFDHILRCTQRGGEGEKGGIHVPPQQKTLKNCNIKLQ